MEIQGYKAIIKYNPEIDMFRGEFTSLNGGADFYATNIAGLRKEGETSLKVLAAFMLMFEGLMVCFIKRLRDNRKFESLCRSEDVV